MGGVDERAVHVEGVGAAGDVAAVGEEVGEEEGAGEGEVEGWEVGPEEGVSMMRSLPAADVKMLALCQEAGGLKRHVYRW